MKKSTIVLIMVITLIFAWTGCGQAEIVDSGGGDNNRDTTTSTLEDYDTKDDPENSETPNETITEIFEAATIETETVATEIPNEPTDLGEPPRSIEVGSLKELSVMKEMIACKDEELVQQYLSSLYGGFAQSKDDLTAFVSLVETTPYVPLVDGNITWISYMTGISVDSNTPYEILYIFTETDHGDWVRLEYLLSEKDVAGKISQESADKGAVSLITSPMRSKDGKITFHTETREKHPTDPGNVINWVANVEGIFTRVVYYTTNANKVVTSDMLSDVEVSTLFTRITNE